MISRINAHFFVNSGQIRNHFSLIVLSASVLLIMASVSALRAQTRDIAPHATLEPVILVSDNFYPTAHPIDISWSVPASMKGPGDGWYEFVVSDRSHEFHTVTSENVVTLDSLPTGLYTYTVIAHNGTDTSSASGRFAVASVGVEQSAETAGVRLFPNPVQASTQKLNILLTGFSGDEISIKLYDSDGDVIDLSNIQRQGDQLVVSARELVNGVYYCEIMSGSNRFTAPLIVER